MFSESERIAEAFREACQHGIHPSYRARINIIGHSGAGKTSLTRRLLGQKFQKKEESTDGIETHRIEFHMDESDVESVAWSTSELVADKLVKRFNTEVLQKKYQNYNNFGVPTNLELQEDTQNLTNLKTKRMFEEGTSSSSTHMPTKRPKLSEMSTDTKRDEGHSTSKAEATEVRKEIIDQLKTAAENMSSAAKSESTDEAKGVLRLWDFGGQTEFYTTHHMFLDADAINIIVMDISKPLKSKVTQTEQSDTVGIPSMPEEFLCYWLRSIEASAEGKQKKPKVILVFTHLDIIPSVQKKQYIEDFMKEVNEILANMKSHAIEETDMFLVDNTERSEENFKKLRTKLQEIMTSFTTWGMLRPIRWLKVEADIRKRVIHSNQKHIKFGEVQELAKDYYMNPEEV